MVAEKNAKFDLNHLQKYAIFSDLSPDQIKQFAKIMKDIHFDKDEVIFHEGEAGKSILLLLEGQVEISQALTLKTSHATTDTREKSLIRLSSDNHPIFGEMSLFNNRDKRTATVKASVACRLGELEKEVFFKLCNSHPEMGYKVMQNIARVLCQRLIQANQNVLKLTTAFSLMLES
jgi:CRP-like cAMP-binding protein